MRSNFNGMSAKLRGGSVQALWRRNSAESERTPHNPESIFLRGERFRKAIEPVEKKQVE